MRQADRLPEYDSLEDVIAEAAARNPRPSQELQRRRAEHTVKQLPNGKLTPMYDLNAPRCWEAQDLWPLLDRITCPTLLVRGEESPVLRREVAQQMIEALPNAEFVEIEGAGHSIGLDNPEDFDAAVRRFLGQLS
jgi:pimeloyl-ACP methyl ester carboxylesterase